MPENIQPEDQSDVQDKPFAAPVQSDQKEQSITIARESLSLGGRLAWLTIAIVVTVMITLTAFFRSSEETRTEATPSDLFQVQLQARMTVGQKNFMKGFASPAPVGDQDEEDGEEDGEEKRNQSTSPPIPSELNDGTYEQRLCYVLLVKENNGADEAAEKLAELDKDAEKADFELNEDQAKLREIVGTLIESHQAGDFDATPLSEKDRDLLKEKLGWLGEIALVPEGTRNTETRKELLSDATWSMGVMMLFFLCGLLALALGFVLAAVFTVFFAAKKLQPAFMTRGKSVNIYIETFALWIVFFFVGPQATGLVIQMLGLVISELMNMFISAGFFFGSLIVLVYPVYRGISFQQMCSDIGWKTKGSIADIALSPFSYFAGMPVMLIGMVMVAVLTLIAAFLAEPKPFGTGVAAGHPIQETFAGGQWLGIAYVVLMACVAAPIVEETMFRGVLYRHLRELSGDWARWGSVIFSALFNALIFAAIHPQGFVGIPVLAALAINFSLVREWRDSLVAPILMHAINNGSVTLLMLLMMS